MTIRDYIEACVAAAAPESMSARVLRVATCGAGPCVIDPRAFARSCASGASRSELTVRESQAPENLLAELRAYLAAREAREALADVTGPGRAQLLWLVERAERITADAWRSAEGAAPFSRWTAAIARHKRAAERLGQRLRVALANEREARKRSIEYAERACPAIR